MPDHPRVRARQGRSSSAPARRVWRGLRRLIEAPVASLKVKSLSQPDSVRELPSAKVELIERQPRAQGHRRQPRALGGEHPAPLRCGTMSGVQAKDLQQPDQVRTFPHGRLELFNIGGIVMARTVFEPGWHWAEHVKPIAGTASCQAHHVGVVLSGSLGVRMDDGAEFTIPPGSAYDIPPGHDGWVIGHEPWVTIDFIGMADFGLESQDDRVLLTILFTDIVESTAVAGRVGDVAWRDLLVRYNQEARIAFERHRVRLVKDTGDGVLALFDSPARAVSSAIELVHLATTHGLQLRAGIHTGEVQLGEGDVRGLAVHRAARVMAAAGSGEVLVSAETRALVASNSSFRLDSRGLHALKGINGEHELWAVSS